MKLEISDNLKGIDDQCMIKEEIDKINAYFRNKELERDGKCANRKERLRIGPISRSEMINILEVQNQI